MFLNRDKILISGGGTGGHVMAGIALADEWKSVTGSQAQAVFVGSYGGLEEKLVPRAGYPLELLRIGALNRVSIIRKFKTVLVLPLSFFKALWILLRERPTCIVGVGGYASGPVLLVASLLRPLMRWKTAILEQNSVPGLTNRILGKFVSRVFTSFGEMESYFSPEKITFTGNPVRSSITRFRSAPRNPFVIFIFGGSQGAYGMNTLVLQALPYLKTLEDRIQLIHQTGETDFERVRNSYMACHLRGRIEKFIFDMPSCYALASLVICRAGSSTMSEIAAAARAAIFIPLPTAADNHQEKNADFYVKSGAALIAHQKKTTGEQLAQMIEDLIKNPQKVAEMEERVSQFYKPDGAKDMVRILKE